MLYALFQKCCAVKCASRTTGQNYATYQYDILGQITAEIPGPAYGNAPAKYITYTVEGLVKAVYSDAALQNKIVEYVYDEMGGRIKKITYNASGTEIKTTWYIGDVIYEKDLGQTLPLQSEIKLAGDIGVYFRQANAYRYEMADHLGNVRAVFVKTSSGTTDFVVFRDYYPFGMEIPGRTQTDGQGYRYGYQGKYSEKENETGWNAFELRMYDSRIGRWLSVDPEGQYHSPYVGMGNDPVNRTDPTGGFSGGDDPPGFFARAVQTIKNWFGIEESFRATQRIASGESGHGSDNNPTPQYVKNIHNTIEKVNDYQALTKPYLRIYQISKAGLELLPIAPGTKVVKGTQIAYHGLEEASRVAFRASENLGSIFIKNKHLTSEATGKFAKFATTDIKTAQRWVREALRSPNAKFLPNDEIPNTFKVVTDLGRPVGTKGQTSIRAIVGFDNRVINAFPVK